MKRTVTGGAKRALRWLVNYRRHSQQRNVGHIAKRRLAAAAVNESRHGDDTPAERTHDVDSLLDATASRHDVFRDDARLALLQRKTAHYERAVLLLGENALLVESAGDFVTDEDAAKRGRNDRCRLFRRVMRNQRGQSGAERLRLAWKAQQVGALEELGAVQPGAQLKMPAQESAGLPKDGKDFFFCHFFYWFSARPDCQSRRPRCSWRIA